MKTLDADKLKSARKKARTENGEKITQESIAGLLGKSVAAYRNWEQGKASPDLDVVFKIAALLKVNPQDIMPDNSPLINARQDRFDYETGQVFRGQNETPVYRDLTGDPVVDDTFIYDNLPFPSSWMTEFAYRVTDERMIDIGVPAGSLLCCQWLSEPRDNDMALYSLDRGGAKVARVKRYPNVIVLHPENKSLPDTVLVGQDSDRVRFFGKIIKAVIDF